MTIKKLVAFGCSWTYGAELDDPNMLHSVDGNKNDQYRLEHCYANLIARHYNLELDNIAFSGSSLESMRWNLMWYLQNGQPRDVLFVVGLTDANRMSWFNPEHQIGRKDPPWHTHIHGTWLIEDNPSIDRKWYNLQNMWFRLSHSPQWAEFNFAQTINLFDQAFSRYNIPVIQVNMLDNDYAVTCPTLLYPGLSFRNILEQKQKDFGTNYFAPRGHPNEQGHRIIADHLIEHIKYSKILEC